MRAFIIKEIREHGKWAAIGVAAICALLTYVLNMQRQVGLSLVDPNFMMVAAIAFWGAGASLGIAMILTDTWRGKWGYIAIRPISRERIFAAKLIAGSVLYLAVTSIAIALVMILATNSQFVRAPFSISMIIPLLYTQLAGLLCMVTGMLIGARRAAWLGSRFFPAVATGMCLLISIELIGYLGSAVAATVIAIGLLILSTVSYFKHNGEYEPQKTAVKPLQWLIVSIGAGAVVLFAFGFVISIVETILSDGEYPYAETYVLTRDGTFYRSQYNQTGAPDYRDINGTPLGVEKSREVADNLLPTAYVSATDWNARDTDRMVRVQRDRFANPSNYLRLIGNERLKSTWTYVVQRGTVEIIDKYGNISQILGADGWHAGKEKAQPFPGQLLEYFPRGMVATSRAVYDMDPATLKFAKRYEATADETILGVGVFADNSEDSATTSRSPFYYLAISTTKNIHIFGREGISATFPFIHRGRNPVLYAGGSESKFYLMESYFDGKQQQQVLRSLSKDGATTSTALAPLNQYGHISTGTEMIELLGIPPAVLGIALYIDPSDVINDGAKPFVMIGIGLLIAEAIVFALCRRYRFSNFETGIWLASTLLVGIAMPVALICLRRRPALVTCPDCGRKRSVEQSNCEHCNAAFGAPSEPAIEVFDSPVRLAL